MEKRGDDHRPLAGPPVSDTPALAELSGDEDPSAALQLAEAVLVENCLGYFDVATRPGPKQVRVLGISDRELDPQEGGMLTDWVATGAGVIDQRPGDDRVVESGRS